MIFGFFFSFLSSDFRRSPLAQRSGMAENVRGLLSHADQQNTELHGGENADIQKHDVHLDRNIVVGPVVGKVRLRYTQILIILPVNIYI